MSPSMKAQKLISPVSGLLNSKRLNEDLKQHEVMLSSELAGNFSHHDGQAKGSPRYKHQLLENLQPLSTRTRFHSYQPQAAL